METSSSNKKRKETKEFVNDGMSTEDIKKTVKNIREYLEKDSKVSKEERIKYIRSTNEFFVNRYQMLFDMVIRDTFDYNSLNYFLNMREKIINNDITAEDASKTIGQEWFNKYIDPSKMKSDKPKDNKDNTKK
jgi:uncharacterized protein with ATP-grasp and redox domains